MMLCNTADEDNDGMETSPAPSEAVINEEREPVPEVTPEVQCPESPVNSTLCAPFMVHSYAHCRTKVIVNLFNLDDPKLPPCEVWVKESATVPTKFTPMYNGDSLVIAQLSQFLPVNICKVDTLHISHNMDLL